MVQASIPEIGTRCDGYLIYLERKLQITQLQQLNVEGEMVPFGGLEGWWSSNIDTIHAQALAPVHCKDIPESSDTVASISNQGVPTTTPSGDLGSEMMDRSAYRRSQWKAG
jgi:hypothetical protein